MSAIGRDGAAPHAGKVAIVTGGNAGIGRWRALGR